VNAPASDEVVEHCSYRLVRLLRVGSRGRVCLCVRSMPKALLIMMALGAAAIWIALGVWLPWWLIGVTAGACAIGLAVTPAGRRTASITAAGIATLPQRLGGASVALVGIAGVVGVLIALLAMGNGFRATLQATGNDETAIVLSLGSVSEIGSMLDQTALKLAATAMRAMRLRVVDTLAGW
jgi:putative ABC transport system permease protein